MTLQAPIAGGNNSGNHVRGIPRRLIQTGRTRRLTGMDKAATTTLRLLHPDWEYLFYDDDNILEFINLHFSSYKEVFHAFDRPIQRVDFFRYLAVYKFGGFYFDLDVFLSEELTPLLSSQCVFPFEELTINRFLRRELKTDWEIGNYAFGAAPGDPFLAKVIESCIKGQTNPRWVTPMMRGIPSVFREDFRVLNTTGPGLLSRTLAENPELARNVTVLFPEDVRDSRYWHHFGAFGVHQMSASWRIKGGFIKRKLALLWEARLRKRLAHESASLGMRRVTPPVRAY